MFETIFCAITTPNYNFSLGITSKLLVGFLQMCHSYITFQGFRGCGGLPFHFDCVNVFQEVGPEDAACTQLDFNLHLNLLFLITKAAQLPKTIVDMFCCV